MTPSAQSLVTPELVMAELKIPAEERDDLIFWINRASEAIVRHCRRSFRRMVRVEFYDSADDDTIRLRHYPIWAVNEVNVDPTRAFLPETILPATDYAVVGRDIYFTSKLGYGDNVVRITSEGGYTLPDYDQEATPATPSIGQVWLSSAGIFRFEATVAAPLGEWVPFLSEMMPGHIIQATMEYIGTIRRRAKPGEAGLLARDRAFADGASLTYEAAMPAHVAALLASEVSHA